MPERFDVRPLIRGLLSGLQKRRVNEDDEVADLKTRVILFGMPAAVLVGLIGFRVELTRSDQILAGAAVLVGALIAAFTQVVSWRERILMRNRETERVKVRALNEAGGHILVSLVTSVGLIITVFVLANLNLQSSELYVHIIGWILSGLSASFLTYIALSLVIVTNLLWDAFKREEQDIADANLPHYPHHEES